MWNWIMVYFFIILFSISCSSIPLKKEGADIESVLKSGVRVMWIAAHPDDESMIGALLLRSSLYYKNPLYFLVFTHGDGGECCIEGGCHPDLKTVRGEELKKVARAYNAELQHEYFYNAPLPMESFPPRHIIAQKWREYKDPVYVVAEAIRRFKPDVVFTFDPYHGFTGHPEHQLASRFAIAGIRAASDDNFKIEGTVPHRIKHLYFGLNKYSIFKLAGGIDPSSVTEVWDMNKECAAGYSCKRLLSEYTKFHKSQKNDMRTVRIMLRWVDSLYLSEYDPYFKSIDPYEEVR